MLAHRAVERTSRDRHRNFVHKVMGNRENSIVHSEQRGDGSPHAHLPLAHLFASLVVSFEGLAPVLGRHALFPDEPGRTSPAMDSRPLQHSDPPCYGDSTPCHNHPAVEPS